MIYKIEIKKEAKKFLVKQDENNRNRLLRAIYQLPFYGDIKYFKDENVYRLRVGDYRVLYEKYDDTLLIDVFKIDNRGDVYKGS